MFDFLLKLLSWHPPVGIFIGILGLVGVLVPLLKKELGPREKAIWTAVLVALTFLELRSIVLYDSDQRQSQIEQNDRFKSIADGLEESLSQSQTQFKATMDELRPTLEASRRAAENTIPRADIQFTSVVPTAPFNFVSGARLNWKVSFVNSGSATAQKWERAGRMYIGKPDDVEEQRRFGVDFDKWWNANHKRLCQDSLPGCPAEIKPEEPNVFTFESDILAADDVVSVLSREKMRKTLYILVRFVWSDGTGTWANDVCLGYQDPPPNFVLLHPCRTHTQGRHAFRRSY